MIDRPKTPRASRVVMTQSVLPGDGNPLGTAFGGRIAQWIDIAGAIACQRHCRRRVVTASMDDLHFLLPIKVGMIVELRAQVNAAFRTSMEAGVRIESESPLTGERAHVCTAYLTFVAQDESGRAVEVPALQMEDDEDRRRAHDAGERRALRLARARIRKERLLSEQKERKG
ncbi:MAG: acyl-CoA thioesterase [Deltaproteobacteria bacterium]|nr:MAG: acyl-CoA thioesterase [Deltaproteobacteria bacterium]